MSHLHSGGNYLGLFKWYQLPRVKLLTADAELEEGRRKLFTFIVNTGAHFVSVVVEQGKLLYLDSFAADIPPVLITLFSEMNGRRRARNKQHRRKKEMKRRGIFRLERQIQSFLSTHCGLYAALFSAWHLVPNKDKMELHFSPHALLENDERCVVYLKKCIGFLI